MYLSRTEISCTSPQRGHLTFSVAFQAARRLCTSVSMPAGAFVCVFGQVKNSEAICGSFLVQAGARPVSLPPAPDSGPPSVMTQFSTMVRGESGCFFLRCRTHRKLAGCHWRSAASNPSRAYSVSEPSNSQDFACPRCKAIMDEVVRIAPLADDPGLIGYECPACCYVTSVILQPTSVILQPKRR